MNCKTYEDFNENNVLTNRYTLCGPRRTLHGLFEIYRRNGSKLCKTNYDMGSIHGSYLEWYDNGQIYIEATFVMGTLVSGTWFKYDGEEISAPLRTTMLAVHNLHP
jgi:antitoxin component YwqK of YwqJK toxin-antitoxin module